MITPGVQSSPVPAYISRMIINRLARAKMVAGRLAPFFHTSAIFFFRTTDKSGAHRELRHRTVVALKVHGLHPITAIVWPERRPPPPKTSACAPVLAEFYRSPPAAPMP